MSQAYRMYFLVTALLFASLACGSTPVFFTPDAAYDQHICRADRDRRFDTECAAGNFICHA